MTARARGLVAAYAAGMGTSWNIANVGPVADAAAAHYGIALASVGLFTAVLFGSELVSMTVIGRLTARYGAKFVGLLAMVLCVLGNVLTLVVDGFMLAMVFRFVVGFGVGLGFVGGMTYVQQMGGGTLAQGIYGGVSLSAGGLAVGTVSFLEGALGWQAPFVTAAVVGAVALVAISLGPATAAGTGDGEEGFVRLLRDRRLLRFAAVQSASFGVGIILSNWVVTLLERRGGYSLETAGVIGALILVVGVFGRPGGGLFAHLRPAHSRFAIRLALLLGAAGTLVLGLAPPLGVAILGAVLVGLASGVPFGPMMAGLGRTFSSTPGAAFGAVNFYVELTIVIGTPLMGATFSLPGGGLTGFAAAAVFCVFAAAVTPVSRLLIPSADHG